MPLPSANALPTSALEVQEPARADLVGDRMAAALDERVRARELGELVERRPRPLLVGEVPERLLEAAACPGSPRPSCRRARTRSCPPCPVPADVATKAATCSISSAVSLSAKEGIPLPPFRTCCSTRSCVRPQLVEVRPDRPGRAGGRHRVTVAAARVGEDLGAGRPAALVVVDVGAPAAAAARHDECEQSEGERDRGDATHARTLKRKAPPERNDYRLARRVWRPGQLQYEQHGQRESHPSTRSSSRSTTRKRRSRSCCAGSRACSTRWTASPRSSSSTTGAATRATSSWKARARPTLASSCCACHGTSGTRSPSPRAWTLPRATQ